MNKDYFATVVATKTGNSKSFATKFLSSMPDGITDALSEGKDVRLTGFGTLKAAQRHASQGRRANDFDRLKLQEL